MKTNDFLTHGGHNVNMVSDDTDGIIYWDTAEEDVKTAILSAAEILADNDCIDIKRYMNGAEKGQALISIAGLILEQRRFYISGAV